MLLRGWECEGAWGGPGEGGRHQRMEVGEKGQVRGSWAGKEGRADLWGPSVATGEVLHACSFVASGMSSPFTDEKTEAQRLADRRTAYAM